MMKLPNTKGAPFADNKNKTTTMTNSPIAKGEPAEETKTEKKTMTNNIPPAKDAVKNQLATIPTKQNITRS